MEFTTPCFIRKNTLELRKKLEELGYTLMCGYDTGFIMTNPEFGVAFLPVGPKVEVDEDSNRDYIDCGTNEELFLAIAALRDDTDESQYFVLDVGLGSINYLSSVISKGSLIKWMSDKRSFPKSDIGLTGIPAHKASVEELIEFFSEKEE